MAENVIFAEKELSFSLDSTFGCYASSEIPASFSIADNEEYCVVWDTNTYTRTAFSFTAADGSSCIAVGNPVAAGLTPNTDTFAIVYDATHNYMWFLSLETKSTHTVGVYQEVAEEAGMNIVLLDHSATPVEHDLPERLRVDTADGGTTEYVHESLVPEQLENVPITLNFSGGNQHIIAEEGTAVKSAVIQQPADLVPENIAKGVNIAGIEGMLIGGGGLPGGVYWKKTNFTRAVTSSVARLFSLNGVIYSLQKNSSNVNTIYRFNGSGWETVHSGSPFTTAAYNSAACIEHKGEMHIISGAQQHYSFDGETVTQYANLGISEPSARSLTVLNGELYIHSPYNDAVYKWVESSDTWEAVFTVGDKYSYYDMVEYNGQLYLVNGKNISKFNGTTVQAVATIPESISTGKSVRIGDYWYMVTGGLNVYRYDFAHNTVTKIGGAVANNYSVECNNQWILYSANDYYAMYYVDGE